jgi:hypothetical protein
MKLFSRTYGEGSPMLILHGLFGMSDNWNTLGKKWAEELIEFLLRQKHRKEQRGLPSDEEIDRLITALTNE